MRTKSAPVLLLAPTPRGWGETAFAVHLGKELIKAGRDVQALICDATAPLFHGSGIAVTSLAESAGPFLGLMLEELINSARPAAVVLCDIVTSVRALKRAGVTADSLFSGPVPIMGVDTWNSAVAGPAMDTFGAESIDAEAWIDRIPSRFMPVPFLNWNAGPGVCRFFPESRPLPSAARSHIRGEFGIGDGEKLVLFCTSPWQHGPYKNPDGERLAAAVPRLISEYLAELDPSVHLVHVGPSRYDGLMLGPDRYHWLPSQRADIFEALLASADLLLSLNVSAVSTIRAVAAELPVVVVGNSSHARTEDDIRAAAGGAMHPVVKRNAKALLPAYPFTLWPLGLKSYLEPTLQGNPFLQALRSVELLDGGRVIETLNELLFSPAAAEESRRKQEAYRKRLMELPAPAAAFESMLYNINGSTKKI